MGCVPWRELCFRCVRSKARSHSGYQAGTGACAAWLLTHCGTRGSNSTSGDSISALQVTAILGGQFEALITGASTALHCLVYNSAVPCSAPWNMPSACLPVVLILSCLSLPSHCLLLPPLSSHSPPSPPRTGTGMDELLAAVRSAIAAENRNSNDWHARRLTDGDGGEGRRGRGRGAASQRAGNQGQKVERAKAPQWEL